MTAYGYLSQVLGLPNMSIILIRGAVVAMCTWKWNDGGGDHGRDRQCQRNVL